MLLSSLLAFSIAALPSLSTSTTPAERLADELSKGAVAIVVDDKDADTARCHANRLVLTATSLSTLKATAQKPEQLPATLELSATRHGVDAHKRRCTAPTTITVEASARRPMPATGTSIGVAVVGEGFVIDAVGVVIPCRKSEQAASARNSDLVCARTSTGRVLTGILDERGTMVVASGAP